MYPIGGYTSLGCGPLELEQFWCRRQLFPPVAPLGFEPIGGRGFDPVRQIKWFSSGAGGWGSSLFAGLSFLPCNPSSELQCFSYHGLQYLYGFPAICSIRILQLGTVPYVPLRIVL